MLVLALLAGILFLLGALLAFRARGVLHWRRGYRDLSSWQRRWLLKSEHVRTARLYGFVFMLLGLVAVAAAMEAGPALQVAGLAR